MIFHCCHLMKQHLLIRVEPVLLIFNKVTKVPVLAMKMELYHNNPDQMLDSMKKIIFFKIINFLLLKVSNKWCSGEKKNKDCLRL